MKLERLHEYILPTVATAVGMGLAAYCGLLSGQGQTGTLVGLVLGLMIMFGILIFRANIWIVVPMAFSLTGQITVLPLPFGVRDIVVMATFVCFLALKALRVVKLKPKIETIDIWMFAILLYLATVYIRNPVGVDALGSDRVGGRPYFNVLIAGLAYWVLARALLAPRHVLLTIGLICFGRMSEGLLSFVTYHFPETVPVLSEFYSTVETETYDAMDVQTFRGEGSQRQVFLAIIGSPLILALWSFFQPLTVINPLYFFRFAVFIFSLVCIFASGFRNIFATAIAMMYIAAYLRRGMRDVVRLSMLAFPMLILLIAGQGTLFELPYSAQRALSFLPGHWDPVAVAEAEGSTEWRVTMWKATLTEDKYIHNKWLGDGFGFSQRDLAAMTANKRVNSMEAQQETMMIVGAVHSGPVSALRYVGVVGLVIYLGLLIVMARTAWRLIQRAKGTEYFPLALFIGLPLIWEPVNFVFIFGGFDSGLPLSMLGVGMLKMLGNSLDAHAAQQASAVVDEPAPNRGQAWQRPPFLVGARRVASPGA